MPLDYKNIKQTREGLEDSSRAKEVGETIIESDEELMDILDADFNDTGAFLKDFLPQTFSRPWAKSHHRLFDMIDNSDKNKKVIVTPRGWGKTSILKGVIIKNVLYRHRHFSTYASKSEGSAINCTEDIKAKLTQTREIRDVFGDVKTVEDDETKTLDEWGKKGFNVLSSRILPRGWKQQFRGLNWMDYRPDLMGFDDLEPDENIKNEEIRKDLKERYYGGVEEAVPQDHYAWDIIYIDTIKHEDALIVELLDDPDYDKLIVAMCDDNYQTLDPTFKTQEQVDQIVRKYRRRHQMDILAREFMAKPISTEDASFNADFFEYYSEQDQVFQKRLREGKIITVVIVDPAKTAKIQNAESAIVVWGIDEESHALYFRDQIAKHFYPDELYNATIDMMRRYDTPNLGVECTGLEEFIKQPFRNAMSRAGLFHEPVWLMARKGEGEFAGRMGGKTGRVASMVSYYRQGMVFHNEVAAISGPYEQQLLQFPRPKRWDIMDCAAYIVYMLEQGMIYFTSEETEKEVDEKEYQGLLEDDYGYEEDFRVI